MADHSSRTSIPQFCSDQITVSQVRATLDQWYPPSLAESWDSPGLVCGDPDDTVKRIVCALEATDTVVDAAIEAHADMPVSYTHLTLPTICSV